MRSENCPVCGEKLWADGATPDGELFIGMATAGYCPKCQRFYYWSTGEPVPDKYSTPRKVSVSVNGGRSFTIFKQENLVVTFIKTIFILIGLIVASPWALFIFFVIGVIEKLTEAFGGQSFLFDSDDYAVFKFMTGISLVLTLGSLGAFIFIRSEVLTAVTLWYGIGALIGVFLLSFKKFYYI